MDKTYHLNELAMMTGFTYTGDRGVSRVILTGPEDQAAEILRDCCMGESYKNAGSRAMDRPAPVSVFAQACIDAASFGGITDYSASFVTGLPQTMFRLPLRVRSSSRKALVRPASRRTIL